MAFVVLETYGWAAFGVTGGQAVAYPVSRWAGPPPVKGQKAAAGAVVDDIATVSNDRATFTELQEDTAYYIGVSSGARWIHTRTEFASSAPEQERAEAAEAAIQLEIEELREATESGGGGTPGRLIFGMNSNLAAGHAAYWTGSRVYGDRSNALDVAYTATPSSLSTAVASSLAAGCKYPLPIINVSDTTVLGSVVAATFGANVRAIVERVMSDHPTVQTFQLINEPYYKHSTPHGSYVGANASTYGALCKAAYEQCKLGGLLSSGAKLIVEAFGQYDVLTNETTGAKKSAGGGYAFPYWIDDVCIAMRDPWGMVIGDSTPDYTNFDSTTVERAEAFQFTCRRSDTVNEVRMRTSSVANTGIENVKFAVCADNAGKPGTVLSEGTRTGEPAVSSWISCTIPSISVVGGTKYWLVILPNGSGGAKLHYMAAQSGATGTKDWETKSGKAFSTITAAVAAAEWEAFDQGPVGIMAGIELARPLYADINGWSNHPYGSLGAANSEGNFNWGSTEGFRTTVSANGAGGNNNWHLSEFGWLGDSLQTANMLPFLEKALTAHQAGWLTSVYAYDDGDGEWTLYNKAGGEALRTFAKAHG